MTTRIRPSSVNTELSYTVGGLTVGNSTVTTLSANSTTVVVNTGFYANGSLGSAGQVLASNGTGLYWATGGNGYTGSQGDIGFTGSAGTNGYTGSQGDQGTTGFVGSKGDIGFTGSQGPKGEFGGAAFEYIFSSNTTHTSTPNGYLNFNNTSFSSATTLYIDYIDNYGANSYSFLQTIDDSTSSIKGHFSIRDTANSLNYAMFAITGSHTEDTDHFDVPVSYLSGVTSFADGTNTVITFARTGNIGDTGFTGSQGNIGYTGSQGDTGYSGSEGYTGSTGTGYVGSQGDIGYSGSLGYTGSKGDQGTIGYTGSAGSGSGGFSNGQSIQVANLVVSSNVTSSNQVSGSITVTGGVGVTDSVYVGNRVGFGNSTNISVAYMFYNANTNSIDTVFG